MITVNLRRDRLYADILEKGAELADKGEILSQKGAAWGCSYACAYVLSALLNQFSGFCFLVQADDSSDPFPPSLPFSSMATQGENIDAEAVKECVNNAYMTEDVFYGIFDANDFEPAK
jgi:hypothetical protein